ncbi:MAG: MotA/TolQ/ExbB proton channel family protein [bacterium]
MEMLEVFNPATALDSIQSFLRAGGSVLVVIMGVTFVLWGLIVERLLFFATAKGATIKNASRAWAARKDHSSWYALAVRDKLVSEVRMASSQNLTIIKGLVAVAPLLGLLGTVTGMVEVFDVMATTGSSSAKLMAGGISKATIPTMAGLVTSLFGIMMVNILEAWSRQAVVEVSDQLDKTFGE